MQPVMGILQVIHHTILYYTILYYTILIYKCDIYTVCKVPEGDWICERCKWNQSEAVNNNNNNNAGINREVF